MAGTITKGLIGESDVQFKDSGTTRATFTRPDSLGRTITMFKIDGADIQFRTIAKSLDDLVDGGGDVPINVSTATVSNLKVTTLDASTWPSFSVNRNDTDQTGITGGDQIEFDNEVFDTNSDYDTGLFRFTPTVAGKYLFTASISFKTTTVGDTVELFLFKNGGAILEQTKIVEDNTFCYLTLTVIVDANGTGDYYEIFAQNVARDTSAINGFSAVSYWMGSRIA